MLPVSIVLLLKEAWQQIYLKKSVTFSVLLSQVDWVLNKTFGRSLAVSVRFPQVSHVIQDYHGFFQWFDFRPLWCSIDLDNILITDKNAVSMLKESQVIATFHFTLWTPKAAQLWSFCVDSVEITSVHKVRLTIYESLWSGTQKSVHCPY